MDPRVKVWRRMVVGLVCLGVLGAMGQRAVGQTQQVAPSSMQFEVVSIKPNPTGRRGNVGMIRDGYQAEDVSLLELVRWTYGLKEDYQILGLPEWVKSAHYDVVAKVGDSDVAAFQKIGYAKMYRLFQPVLEDRFMLRCHWEKRVLPTYTLTLAKKGSALEDSTVGDDKMITMGQMTFGPGSIVILPDGLLISRAAPISMLVQDLQGELNKVVVDETGLKGTYDYQMQLPRASQGADSAAPEHVQPGEFIQGSLYQIGLRLVESKSELSVLVVDAIQQPSAN